MPVLLLLQEKPNILFIDTGCLPQAVQHLKVGWRLTPPALIPCPYMLHSLSGFWPSHCNDTCCAMI